MNVKTRFTNAAFDHDSSNLYMCDDKGIVYCFDEKLLLLKQSTPPSNGVTLHGICTDEAHVYVRDVAGNVICLCKEKLLQKHFFVSQHYVSPENEGSHPVPSPSHAIVATDRYLIFCNARGSLSFLNKKTFSFNRSIEISENAFLEHLSLSSCKKYLYVNDIIGNIFILDLEKFSIKKIASLHSGVSHSMVYDSKHKRFMISSDVGGGVHIVNEAQGIIGWVPFTNDDVEEIVLSDDQDMIYVACFDHHIYVLKNHESPVVLGKIGKFKFQVNHLKKMSNDKLLAMLESGEVYVVSTSTYQILSKTGGTAAYWDLYVSGKQAIATSESGNLDIFQINSQFRELTLTKIDTIVPKGINHRMRITKSIANGFVSICGDGKALRYDRKGNVQWEYSAQGILRDISISKCQKFCAFCSELGEIIVVDLDTCSVIKMLKNNKPVWCIHYCPDGSIVYGERELRDHLGGRTKSKLCLLDENLKEISAIETYGNFKRIRELDNNQLLISSNTLLAVFIVDLFDFSVKKSLKEWQINTPENSIIYGRYLYVVTYGYQLITYDIETDEVIDVQYILEGYPMGLDCYRNDKGEPFLIASCRNAIMAFTISQVEPELISCWYLNETLYRDFSEGVGFQQLKSSNYQLTTQVEKLQSVG
ncbi:hypothetical protein FKG94_25175 [Exilibacterium tricleocarpae]|uniref:Uncharacterized protein n=1 Tax=Exilibacterium tricleocarpae TaxID=2591008 RepID=A0A545SRR7_9GAMM|nr:hypothetical protein [Exilibacterium tricleocarpae]TQV67668.1 hypothetical protein FKG94_25175 [Exilibacterium tricleocarpae]